MDDAMNREAEANESFSLAKRAKSFVHAGRGLRLFLKTTHNAWVHIAILVAVIIAGLCLHISRTDWMFIVLAAGLVLSAEAFNTAIEIDMDLTSPDYHPAARDTKDVAAAAVLIASIAALAIGIAVFWPYML